MQKMNIQNNSRRQAVPGSFAGALTALFLVLVMFTGCVTQGPVKPAAVEPEKAESQEDPAAQLDDGRDGFVINEVAKMDAAARRDFDRAVALLEEKAYGNAIALLEKIVAQSPVVTAPYINLGIAYARTGKADKAEAQFKKALALFPGHPVASNECGLLYRKNGRFDEARAMYEQALAGYPNYYPVYRNLGILCDLYLGDLEAALGHYETYSRAMPEDQQVKRWIADLRARLGLS